MRKSLILLLLAFSAMSSYAYDAYINGVYYNLVPKAKQAQVTYNGDGFYTGDIVIPDKITSGGVEYSVTAIGEHAFDGCSSLTSIEIPNSVTSIGYSAFSGCSSLTSIEIPNSVTSIGEGAFYGCSSLTSIEIPNSVTSIGYSAFCNCSSLTSIEIPNSVTSVGDYAFYGCSSLTSIEIPNSVTDIGYGAFMYCTSLTSIGIPNSVESIGEGAFQYCNSLTSIEIPNSVVLIFGDAFYGCENLTNITLGDGILSILENAFANCPKIENVYCNAVNAPDTYPDSFEGSYIDYANLYVRAESLEAYKAADVWKNFGNIRPLSDVTFAEAINVSATKIVLSVNETETLTANVLPANATNKSVIWSSSNSDIVSVNAETGEVAAVSYGSAEISATANDGCNATGSVTITVKAEKYALTDGEEYLNGQEFPCDELTYTRDFTDTNWNALYVPFAMNYDDWADNFEVARLNDVHQFDDDEDGVVDRTVLESVKLKTGSKTEPNTPYLIKAKTTGNKTISLTNTTLYATEENSFDVTSWFTKFTFTGTYNTVTNMATQGHYALADGGLKQASSDAVTLGAFRWYLDITDRNGNPTQLKSRKVLLSFDDGETTAIDVISTNIQSNSPVYSISGVKVANGAALPKGLYIKNGKKVLVK